MKHPRRPTYFIISALLLTLSTQAWAQQIQSFDLRYASVPWNMSSKQIDSAFMFIRDKTSGKTVKINVEESEPDSSLFTGKFSVNWEGVKSLIPEVYIPPQNMRNDSRAVEKFNNLLSSGSIQPQPTASKMENGKYTVEVYDSQEQADRAQKAYTEQDAALKKAERAKLVKPQLNDSSLQVTKMAEQANEIAQLAKAAATREAERIHLEQIEQQKIDLKMKEQEKLARADVERRKAKAKELAEKASSHYAKAEFKEAEALFRQSMDLDPSNSDYLFKYGVSLYRIEKYDESLVILKLAKTDAQTEIEKKYYMGLIHFKLKELAQARNYFATVRESKDPTLAASAAFYEGLVLLAEDDLVRSQAAFEFVLDNSNDPALDKKAEEFIEKIAALLEYKKIASKKLILNATVGAQYDSNILLSPDSTDASSGTSSEKGGLRGTLGGSVEYRAFYKEKSDLSTKASLNATESASTDFTTADSMVLNISAPYNIKNKHKNTAYKFGVTPGYEYLQLHDGSGQPMGALQSLMLNADLMLVMRDNWISSYNLDIRRDNSLLPDGGALNADAIKSGLKKTEMLFLDSTKKRAVIGSLGYTINNAEGDDKKYDRIDLMAIYTAPILQWRNTTWNGGVTTFVQNYPSSSDKRRDTNVGLLVGLTKIFSEDLSLSSNFSYNDNTSTESASDYSKYILSTTLNYSWSK